MHAGHRAGEGLSSSRRHYPNVPRPLRRGVLRGCTFRIFTASMAFTLRIGARLSLSPPFSGTFTTRQASRDATDRPVAPPQGLSTLGFAAEGFPSTTPVCYGAS